MTADRSTDFGRKIREARERRGASLREIANATKISVRALEALERNDISQLPGGIFSRAFVRAYAVEVGLPPEETVQEFIAQFPHDSVTAGHPTASPVEDGLVVESERSTALTFLRLAGISLPIIIAALYFVSRGRPVQTPAALAPAASAPAAVSPGTSEPTTGRSPGAPATAPSTPAAAAASTAPEPLDPSRLTVVVAATRPCWISARVDGEKILSRTLQAGERQTLEVRNELVITAGDAAALVLTLNGAEARVLGKSGEVVTARLGPANFRDYLLNP